MVEKSAAGFQTAPSRPPVKTGQTESLAERMDRISNAISRRAFELFERDGHVNGNDVRNWLEAESELLHPVHVDLEETSGEFVVRAEVPGFTASDLEVNVEPRRVTIAGKRESKKELKKGDAIYAKECSDEIFRAIDLPSEVNAAKVSATLKDGVLDVLIPKADPGGSSPRDMSVA